MLRERGSSNAAGWARRWHPPDELPTSSIRMLGSKVMSTPAAANSSTVSISRSPKAWSAIIEQPITWK